MGEEKDFRSLQDFGSLLVLSIEKHKDFTYPTLIFYSF
jgi:hypothetical protein